MEKTGLQKGLDAINKYINKQLNVKNYDYTTRKSKKFWPFHVLAKIYTYQDGSIKLVSQIKKWRETVREIETKYRNITKQKIIQRLEEWFREI